MSIGIIVGTSTTATGFPDFSQPYTQRTDGNCQDDPIDPITAQFFGDAAGITHTVDSIERHAGWYFGDGSHQNLRVKMSGTDMDCKEQRAQRANRDGVPNSRYHIRVWPIPATAGGDPDKKAVGDPHHEDWVWSCPGHAVDKNGSNGSGFDQGRRLLRDLWQLGGHNTDAPYWGNTRNFRQCDGDYAGSNGNAAVLHINHQHN